MEIPLYKSTAENDEEYLRETIYSMVSPILDRYGVTGGWRLPYYNFAYSLYSRLRKAKTRSYKRIVRGRIEHFINKQRLDPQILEEIVESVFGLRL
jgi:hypothetical protein